MLIYSHNIRALTNCVYFPFIPVIKAIYLKITPIFSDISCSFHVKFSLHSSEGIRSPQSKYIFSGTSGKRVYNRNEFTKRRMGEWASLNVAMVEFHATLKIIVL